MGILALENVTKRYDQVVAVDQVSFDAHPGRILGLLGPNGAGKTSTIRMIAYITIPDEGRVLYEGRSVGAWSQRRMGYLPEERGLYKKMKVGEQLLYFAELKGMTHAEARKQVDYWLERFGAHTWFGKKTEELSKGMQQKVQFILSILHRPSLIILDEPFSGLDPINSDLLEEVILELKAQGCTILFASHRMEQVEQLCDDICLISRGRIVLQGSVREVKRRYGRNTVLLDFEGGDGFLNQLEQEGKVRISLRSHTHAELQLRGDTPPRQVLEAALAQTDMISRFELVEPPLKEIFVQVVGEQELAEQKSRDEAKR